VNRERDQKMYDQIQKLMNRSELIRLCVLN
jgi:hypothetical protein